MSKKYNTVQGDTWDIIAKKMYSDESYATLLLNNNIKLIDYFVFPAGIEVNIPAKPESTNNLPEWRS